MVRIISKVGLAAVCLLALAVFTQQAKASGADFQCGTGGCSGTVAVSGGNYSTTGLTGLTNVLANTFNIPGFDTDEQGESSWSLVFDTGAKTITLSDSDAESIVINGTILSVTHMTAFGQTTVDMVVRWNIPGFGGGIGSVGFLVSNGTVNSLDVSILPTPEPASLLLLGTGLLGMGAAVRRRLL